MPGLSELQHRINERIKATPPVRVIVISFVLIILVGTLLLMLPISSKVGGATPIDALFTITSATCVTGLVVGDTFTLWTPFGQGVILACIQLGGLGLSTLAIGFSLLVRRKLGIREMKLASESSGGSGLDIAGLLKLTIIFTFACEAIGACLLAIRFVPMFGVNGIWPSIFCAISAYCNAGFDVLGFVEGNSSMTAFAGDPLVSLTISFLIIIGGLGFIVVQDIYLCKIQPRFHHKDTTRLNFHSQICLRVTIVLLLFGTLGFFLLEFGNTMEGLNILEKLNCAFFQSTNTRHSRLCLGGHCRPVRIYKSALCAADVYWRLSRLHRRRHQNHYFDRAAVHGYLHHPGQGRSGGAAPPFFHAGGVQGFQPDLHRHFAGVYRRRRYQFPKPGHPVHRLPV